MNSCVFSLLPGAELEKVQFAAGWLCKCKLTSIVVFSLANFWDIYTSNHGTKCSVCSLVYWSTSIHGHWLNNNNAIQSVSTAANLQITTSFFDQ